MEATDIFVNIQEHYVQLLELQTKQTGLFYQLQDTFVLIAVIYGQCNTDNATCNPVQKDLFTSNEIFSMYTSGGFSSSQRRGRQPQRWERQPIILVSFS